MHVKEALPLIFGVPHKTFYKDFNAASVFVAELRPGLEGIKTVSKELLRRGIQPVIICDNMMAHCMERGLVKAVHIFYGRLTKKKAACRTGSLVAAIAALKHQIPVRLHRGRAGGRKTSLLRMDGRKVTQQNIKTYAPLSEDVPLVYIEERSLASA